MQKPSVPEYDRNLLRDILIGFASTQVISDTGSNPEEDLAQVCDTPESRSKFESSFRAMMADPSQTFAEKARDLAAEDFQDETKARKFFTWAWQAATGTGWIDVGDSKTKSNPKR